MKRLHVKQKIHNELTHGQIAIVRDGEGYALIPAQVAEKIQQRIPAAIVLLNNPTPKMKPLTTMILTQITRYLMI